MSGFTRIRVSQWMITGKREGASHILLMRDQASSELLPVYVLPSEEVESRVIRFERSFKMRLIAVLDLGRDFEQQLDSISD
jgi:hypothetical protein